MKKQLAAGIAALLLCAGLLSGCTIGNTRIMFEGKAAAGSSVISINGKKCSLREAKVYLCNYKNLYGTAYGVDLWQYDFGEESLEDYVKEVTLDELSRIMCMEQIAKEQGISLTAEENALAEQAAKLYYESLSDAEKNYMGVSRDNLKDYYEQYALAQKLYRTMTEDASGEVSDDEARIIRVNRIYVTDEDIAKTVAAKLEAGEEFSGVASSYSELPEYALTVGRGELPEEVEEVAFNMENGEISKMIASGDGYYFLECVSKYEEELSEANKVAMLRKKKEAAFVEAYDAFVEEMTVELNESVWESVTIAEQASDITTDSFFAVYEEVFEEEG